MGAGVSNLFKNRFSWLALPASPSSVLLPFFLQPVMVFMASQTSLMLFRCSFCSTFLLYSSFASLSWTLSSPCTHFSSSGSPSLTALSLYHDMPWKILRQLTAFPAFAEKLKSLQHPEVPGGHPSKYYPGPTLRGFRDRTRSGAFRAVWPQAKGRETNALFIRVDAERTKQSRSALLY